MSQTPRYPACLVLSLEVGHTLGLHEPGGTVANDELVHRDFSGEMRALSEAMIASHFEWERGTT